jgi:aminoglycoside phosphotransferase (APT) family kinase protein
LPDGDRLLHGDFHPDNVMLTARGLVIIDWTDATRGHPLADVARSQVLMTVGSPLDGGPKRWIVTALRGAFRSAYLRRYFQVSKFKRTELEPWIAVVAAVRLRGRIPGERARLLEIVRAAL